MLSGRRSCGWRYRDVTDPLAASAIFFFALNFPGRQHGAAKLGCAGQWNKEF